MTSNTNRRQRRRSAPPLRSDILDRLGLLGLGILGLAWLSQKSTQPGPSPMPQYLGIPTDIFDFAAAAQEQDMWCWAASVQMLLKYYGIEQSQEQIVARAYGHPFNEPGTDEAISASLHGWGIKADRKRFIVQSRVIAGPPAPHVLFRELSSGRPILLTFSPGFAVGHAVVVTAARAVNRQIISLVYRDPNPTPSNLENCGRIELSFGALASFLPSIRSHWLVSVREA
jgi:hypothetical protein